MITLYHSCWLIGWFTEKCSSKRAKKKKKTRYWFVHISDSESFANETHDSQVLFFFFPPFFFWILKFGIPDILRYSNVSWIIILFILCFFILFDLFNIVINSSTMKWHPSYLINFHNQFIPKSYRENQTSGLYSNPLLLDLRKIFSVTQREK